MSQTARAVRDSAPAALGTRSAGRSPAERIRVVYCINTLNVGGTELNAVRTAEHLDRDSFDLRFVCIHATGPLLARLERIGVPVAEFPIRNLYTPATWRRSTELARYLRDERIDVVHAHDQYSNLFASLSARRAGVTVIIASKRWGRPPLKYRIVAGAAFRLAHRVLANSESVAESLRREDGVPAGRVHTVLNFVDSDAFSPPPADFIARTRAELSIGEGVPVIAIVASLYPVKDHDTLFRAVARLVSRWPSLMLLVVGEGGSRPGLEQLARELGITDNVRFAGRRPHSPTMHHLADVSVLCSRSEGFPNSIVEAMAAGKPVVATAVGGIGDAVQHGTTGWLVPPALPEALSDALAELLADPAKARAFGEAGRAFAEEHYSARRVIPSLEGWYRELLADARR